MRHSVTLLLVLVGVLSLEASFAKDAKIPLRGTRFISYYQGPVARGFPATLTVVFYRAKPAADQAENVLRYALGACFVLDAKTDILATAYYTRTARETDEEVVPLRDGFGHLLYSAKARKILTWKEYLATKPRTGTK